MKARMWKPAGLLLLVIMITLPLLSCGSSSDDTSGPSGVDLGEVAQLVSDIAQAESTEDRTDAINEVVKQGVSLGLLDESGNQLNENVAADAVSLAPEDIAAFAAFVDDGRYQTIDNVVDYLAEVGVVLSATGEIITTEDVLPDIQTYVDWCFAHPDDPDSQLGILLASGPAMKPPASAPQITADTQISPMAAVLMLGDILIGKPQEDTTVMDPFVKTASADEVQQTAAKILGLITKIESGLNSTYGATASILMELGKKVGVVDKGTSTDIKIEVPALAKKIISAFAFGNYFQVRMRTVTVTSIDSLWPIDKSLLLDAVDPGYLINPVLVLAPAGANEGSHYEIMQEVPVVFTARLLSANEAGTGNDLFPDANAVLAPGNAICKTAANGHRLDAVASADFAASFYVRATKLDNTVERHAVLHTSASILTGDLSAQFKKYKEQYGLVIKTLGLTAEELADMFNVMSAAVKVAPTMSQITLFKGGKATISPETFNGKPGDACTFNVRKDSVPDGAVWSWEVDNYRFDPDLEKITDPAATITFPDAGNYTVRAILWDKDPDEISARKIDWAEAAVTITGGPMEIEITGPDITGPGQPLVQGKEYTFIAKTGAIPDDPIYVWYFPDGTQEIPMSNEVTWALPDTGNWLVAVDLFNADTTTRPVQSARIEVKVIAPEEPARDLITELHEMRYFDLGFQIFGKLPNGNPVTGSLPLGDYTLDLTWNGVDFSSDWNNWGRVVTVRGSVSEDGKFITHLTVRLEAETDKGTDITQVELANIPLMDLAENSFGFVNLRVNVKQYVTSFTSSHYDGLGVTWDWEGDGTIILHLSPNPL